MLPSVCYEFNYELLLKIGIHRLYLIAFVLSDWLSHSSPEAGNFIKKRDSGRGAFLWVLQNFQEHIFYRTPPDDFVGLLSLRVKNNISPFI